MGVSDGSERTVGAYRGGRIGGARGLASAVVVSSADPPSETSTEAVPPVVLVMVAHDPGWWFDETLASVAAQDYPALTTLVVDAGSADPEAIRASVAAHLPDAHVRRLPENPGFAAAANEVRSLVQGAAFHVFCHDDIRLAPDAVRLLVEEAFRSNAGIVGPKLVEWSDSRRLLSVGMGADRFGHPAPYVERGDLDQEQHDAVRDVFLIPGAATLVRADLFEAIDGFDPEIDFHGEDLDLCWRAHVAGARVLVAPSAVVAHLEALGVRRPVDDRRRLQARHRLRAMRVSQTLGTRIRTVPEAAVLSLAEMVQAVLLGHFRRARDVGSAWLWNTRHRASARRRRELLAGIRRVDDGEVHGFQSRGSARLSGFLRTRVVRSDAAAGGREFVSNLRSARSSTAFLTWLAIVAYLLVGSRELVLRGVPAVGDFVSLLGPGEMFSRWTSGWQSVGLGASGSSPTGFGVLGALGVVFLGATGVLRSVVILGLWPLGALGMWRFTRPIASTRARLLATVIYTVIPVAPNAMAQGQWGTLVVYAMLPWVIAQIAAASRIAPFGVIGDAVGPGVRERSLRHRIVLTGVLVALAMLIEPAAAPIVVGVGAMCVVGGLFAGQLVGALRMVAVAVGSVVVALVLHLPWSLSFLDGWEAIVGVGSNGGYPLEVADVLRFGTGPYGTGVIGWAVLVTAALVLFIGRRWRLGWAVRAWMLALAGFGLAWVVGEGWATGWLPSASSMLVVSAFGVALAAGLGMVAFEVDLPDYRFGWRQLLSLVAAVAFVISLGPALGAAMSGRWATPRGDFDRSLSFLDDGQDDGVSRILWIGDATALPIQGWSLDAPNIDDLGPGRALAFATTMGGTPSIAEQWPGAATSSTDQISSAIRIASEGGTARLGALLAPMGVREIVVPLAPAPDPYAQSRSYVPSDLLAVLDAQLDLASVTVNPGVRLYRNSAWAPVFSQLGSADLPDGGERLADRTSRELADATSVLTQSDGYGAWSGSVSSGALYAAVGGDEWALRVDGAHVHSTSAFGWAQVYDLGDGGEATFVFETPAVRRYLLFAEVLLWLAVIVYLLRGRVRVEERALLAADDEPSAPTETTEPKMVVAAATMPSASAAPTSTVPADADIAPPTTPFVDPVDELLATIRAEEATAEPSGDDTTTPSIDAPDAPDASVDEAADGSSGASSSTRRGRRRRRS